MSAAATVSQQSSGSNLPARGARGRASRPVWPAAASVGHTVAHEAAPRRAGSLGPSGAAPVTPFEDLHSYIAIQRVTGLRLSPDGTWLAATVQQPDPDGKKYSTGIWRIPADGEPPSSGPSAQPIRLTQSAQGEDGPAFLPDGSRCSLSAAPTRRLRVRGRQGRGGRTAPNPRYGCCPRRVATPAGSPPRRAVPAGSSPPAAPPACCSPPRCCRGRPGWMRMRSAASGARTPG